jgi:ferritin-like metal-binding protein YciE
MAMNNLTELFKHELGDLLFAEKTILKGLKKMAREVSEPAMKQRLEQHQGETENQITRLEQAFEAAGLKVKATECPGILGIMKEHDEFKEDEEPSKQMLEAFDLGSGLRVEHYEIAAYQTAIAIAKTLGHRQSAALLNENLAEEVAMAKFIQASAAASLKTMPAMEQEDGGGRTAAKSTRKRATAKKS